MKPEEAGGGYDPSSSAEAAQVMAAMAPFIMVILLMALAVWAFMIFCYWRIFSKAGYSGALSLLLLVPLANIILIVWFAFAQWPALNGGGAAPAKT